MTTPSRNPRKKAKASKEVLRTEVYQTLQGQSYTGDGASGAYSVSSPLTGLFQLSERYAIYVGDKIVGHCLGRAAAHNARNFVCGADDHTGREHMWCRSKAIVVERS